MHEGVRGVVLWVQVVVVRSMMKGVGRAEVSGPSRLGIVAMGNCERCGVCGARVYVMNALIFSKCEVNNSSVEEYRVS